MTQGSIGMQCVLRGTDSRLSYSDKSEKSTDSFPIRAYLYLRRFDIIIQCHFLVDLICISPLFSGNKRLKIKKKRREKFRTINFHKHY